MIEDKDTLRITDMAGVVDKFAPGYRLKQKTASVLMGLIGGLMRMLGSPDFESAFWTTLPRLLGGSTTYRPSATDTAPEPGEFVVIAHEGLHAQQVGHGASPAARIWQAFRYAFLYLFPQSVGILGVLYAAVALIGDLPLWPAVTAALLAPLPAPWRSRYEEAAYRVSVAADYWHRGGMSAGDETAYTDWIVKQFTGPSYYFMAPFSTAALRCRFGSWFAMLRSSASPTQTEYLVAVRGAVEQYRAEDSATETHP